MRVIEPNEVEMVSGGAGPIVAGFVAVWEAGKWVFVVAAGGTIGNVAHDAVKTQPWYDSMVRSIGTGLTSFTNMLGFTGREGMTCSGVIYPSDYTGPREPLKCVPAGTSQSYDYTGGLVLIGMDGAQWSAGTDANPNGPVTPSLSSSVYPSDHNTEA